MGSTTDGSGWFPYVPQRDGLDCIGKSRIAIPLCKSFMTLETPICRLRLSGISRHASSLMDGVDPVGKSRITISCCECSMSLETSISRSATFVRSLTPVPCERTAQISSVNRGSRFRVARTLCIRNSRYADSRYAELRLSGILCHVFLLFGRLRSLREIAYRDFLMQRFYTPQISDERNPDAFQDVDTCPAEING